MRPAGSTTFWAGQQRGTGKRLRRRRKRRIARHLWASGPGRHAARIIAKSTKARFLPSRGDVGHQGKTGGDAGGRDYRKCSIRDHILIDEIPPSTRPPRDAFLPHVESGDIVLIGATTENPSFEVNSALLSRSKVYVLRPLSKTDIRRLLDRALQHPEGLAPLNVNIAGEELELIAESSQGDARAAHQLESSPRTRGRTHRARRDRCAASGRDDYDKAAGALHIISALHKSMRNSDRTPRLWLARMLESAEDPSNARRVRSQRICRKADPRALRLALGRRKTAHFLECTKPPTRLPSRNLPRQPPKINAVTVAYGEAREDIQAGKTGAVPHAIRNAPTPLMKELGYGSGYRYAHDRPEGVADLECLPEDLEGRQYYRPTDRGFEKTIRERIAYWKEARARKAGPATRTSVGPLNNSRRNERPGPRERSKFRVFASFRLDVSTIRRPPRRGSRRRSGPTRGVNASFPQIAQVSSSISETSGRQRRLDVFGQSRRSFSFFAGSTTRVTPARLAASTFSLMPPTGSTFPRSVISPVMARSDGTGRPATSDRSDVNMVTPADGPSFGIAPAGTWMWKSFRSNM